MDVYKKPTGYHHHCAQLEHGIYYARDVFRCQHFKKWFPILQANNYHEFLNLGFGDWVPFTKHHTMRDNVASRRAMGNPRVICDNDEPCRHMGYQPQYPWLGNAASRRRRCFRILPSASRFDITNEIESEGRSGGDVATWTPCMVMLFSPRDADKVCRKRRRKIRYESSVPLKWNREMMKTLEKVELLELAFNDDRDMEFVCGQFGNLSFEAAALRTIRKLVAPPEVIKPGTSRTYGTWPLVEEPIQARGAMPNKAGDTPVDSTARQDGTKITQGTAKFQLIESTNEEAENGEEPQDTHADSEPVEDTHTTASTEEIAFVSSGSDDEESSEDEELLPPPVKRRRYSPPANEFPYTRQPRPSELEEWSEVWKIFYRVQEQLKRGPGRGLRDSTRSTIPLPPKGSRRARQRKAIAEDGVSSDGSTDEDEKIDRNARSALHKEEWGRSYPISFTFGTTADARFSQLRDGETKVNNG